MQSRSRRALLRAAAVAACGAIAGCAGQRPETLAENCTEGLTDVYSGSVSVDESRDDGARFVVTLPAATTGDG